MTAEFSPQPAHASPTQVRPIPPRPRPLWPKVIGVVSVALAILGLFLLMLQMAMTFRTESEQALVSVAGTLASLLLLAGGITLFNRRDAGRKLLKIWSMVQLTLLFAAALVMVITFGDSAPKVREKNLPEFIVIMSLIPVLATYPVFLLIWLTRRFVRRDLSGW